MSSSDYVPSSSKLSEIMQKRANGTRPWFSLEFFLPYTDTGSEDLIGMIEYFVKSRPLFYSIVAKTSSTRTTEKKSRSSIDMANAMINFCGVETVLHFCWANETVENAKTRLQQIAKNGVRTLFIIRGDDGGEGNVENGFSNSVEFIKFVKTEFGGDFCIGVAGYPEGHPAATNAKQCLGCLREKVNAGADFIISQFFFDSALFIDFLRECRAIGIKCPIIPCILPISNYNSIMRIIENSGVNVPPAILAKLESIKSNDESVERFGIDLAVEMCNDLIKSNLVSGFHFCTLNRRTAVKAVIDRLDLVPDNLSPPRELPWRQSAKFDRRANETVRPIFWSVRPKSYMYRSSEWEQFPNGRWGNPSLASFRDVDEANGQESACFPSILKHFTPKVEWLFESKSSCASIQMIWSNRNFQRSPITFSISKKIVLKIETRNLRMTRVYCFNTTVKKCAFYNLNNTKFTFSPILVFIFLLFEFFTN